MISLTILLMAFITGAILGAIFNYFKLQIPAPPTVAGIVGVIGVYVGYKLVIFLTTGSF